MVLVFVFLEAKYLLQSLKMLIVLFTCGKPSSHQCLLGKVRVNIKTFLFVFFIAVCSKPACRLCKEGTPEKLSVLVAGFKSRGGLVLIYCTRTCLLLKIAQRGQTNRIRMLVHCRCSNRDVILAISVNMTKYIIT